MKIITEKCKENILDNADVKSIVGHYLELKKSGANFQAISPFSNEKTGSLMVCPSKGIWKDFSSGKGGGPIKFIMEKEGLSFFEALEEAARICKIELVYEELKEEQKEAYKVKEAQIRLLEQVSDNYSEQLNKLSSEHWVKKMIEKRKWKDETIAAFHLGYAPAIPNYIASAVIEKGQLSRAKEIGLVRTDAQTQMAYDFFRDRLLFPIQNFYGQVIAFGGRVSNENQDKQSKYINSPFSVIYNKDKVLYGLFQAKAEIRKQDQAILVEGYADVISVHQAGVPLAVASCGTALTDTHCLSLKKLCSHVIIWRDGDTPGIRATHRDINILLKHGFKVSVLLSEDKKDPDDMAREKGENLSSWIKENLTDALIWKAIVLISGAENPDETSSAVQEICNSISCISDEIKREEYIKEVSRNIKQKQSTLKKIINEKTEEIKEENSSDNNTDIDFSLPNLPKGADKEQYLKDRFCEVNNSYYFFGKDGFFKGNNFIMKPLFHIYGKNDNKRLCEITNELGNKRLVDFESKDLNNFNRIQEILIGEGNFHWEGNVSNLHFKLVIKKILNDFIMAYELKTLGWQREGFFAFADGVYFSNQFQKVNKYGIVQLNNLEVENSEYRGEVKHYYSPAFSEVYKLSREDDDPYENDRNFVYKVAPISLDQWMQQMVKVYGEKGIIGIGFAFATVFRDIYLKKYSFFPHLGLFGEKGSGKSTMGESIQNLFFFQMEPFDLNTGTVVGFTRRLARVKNVATLLEEYNDKIHEIMFQAMKGAYDGRGREKGKESSDNRTSTTKVNCSVIYAGQYYPARDDNSLATRSIMLAFIKKSLTNEERENYNTLKSWEEKGLSSLVLSIVRHRELFEDQFENTYKTLLKKLKIDLDQMDVQERMINNYLAILTPIYILYNQFTFPFSKEDLYKLCVEMIISTSDLITDSEGLAEFWSMLEYLIEEGRIKEGKDYKIEIVPSVKLGVKKGGKTTTEEWKNTKGDKVLYIYLKKIYQDMQREAARRGVDLMNETTIKNYFRAKKYLIGGSATTRLGEKSQSCYAFNYSQMEAQGILNIAKEEPHFSYDSSESEKENETFF